MLAEPDELRGDWYPVIPGTDVAVMLALSHVLITDGLADTAFLDRYTVGAGRYLAYVMVKKDGNWVNYNIECVRHGFSPYFVKYGRSRRFHREFLEAQKLARDAKLGIMVFPACFSSSSMSLFRSE